MTTTREPDYTVRPARPEDADGIDALDTSFSTGTVFEVAASGIGFTLREVPVDPPLVKVFPDDDDDDDGDDSGGPYDRTLVAIAPGGELAGYVTVSHAPWNRRLTIEDIGIAPAHRRRGIGRLLVERAADLARSYGAAHLWLEVTNVNAPAIHAYLRLGFTFCGLDTTLYDGTASAGEQALFMSRPCT
ncbi:GNAT family N-acetyltransferase [Streptomyces bambusae]|uniref:GNAT family N-acetyltransferase n=1 Tax=Streptomyces bambusae TaxID=1550616 RepID=UPI001CFEAC35|nr:GNAT family N-acetyltransferase [Streptomyces bambusae]MCB5163884.1 GNAT family N-acetyltransferase [Streptomyces bambusae]